MSRGRLFRIAAPIAALAVIATLFVAYIYSWTEPAVYRVPEKLKLEGALRPFEERERILSRTREAYVLRLEGEKGALVYFGSRGTNDPGAPEIRAIKKAWEDFEPTVALCEGRLAFFVGGFERGVRRFGESGAVYALARGANVPVFTLQPEAAEVVAELTNEFPAESVVLYLALGDYLVDRDRGRVGEDAAGVLMLHLKKWGGFRHLERTLETVAEFESLWDKDFAVLGDWREVDRAVLAPGGQKTELNAIARVAFRTRSTHMARAIIDLVRHGERVFAVCDADHVLGQEPQLRAALAK